MDAKVIADELRELANRIEMGEWKELDLERVVDRVQRPRHRDGRGYVYDGEVVTLRLYERREVCPTCKGTGLRPCGCGNRLCKIEIACTTCTSKP